MTETPRFERWHFWIDIATLAGLVVGVVTLILAIWPLRRGIERTVELAEKNVFRVDFPVGGAVGMSGVVYGQSPYPYRKNYVVVSPIKTGDNFVQRGGPVKVGPDGSWSGSATYGSGAVGAGEEFMVRAMATDVSLSAGPLSDIPNDAVFSRPVVVIRRD